MHTADLIAIHTRTRHALMADGWRAVDTDDAAQEAVTRLLAAWSTGHMPADPAAWSIVTARRWLLGQCRHHMHPLPETLAQCSPPPPAPEVGPVLSNLSARDRRLVICRHWLGQSITEISRAEGKTYDSTKHAIRRAILACRRGALCAS